MVNNVSKVNRNSIWSASWSVGRSDNPVAGDSRQQANGTSSQQCNYSWAISVRERNYNIQPANQPTDQPTDRSTNYLATPLCI